MSRLPAMNALKAFEAAARLGSFKAAADELCVTPSAVSHQVANLEDLIGAPLFRRRGRRLTLNAAGETYCRTVGEALNAIARATEAAADKSTDRVLTIAAAPSLAAKWLMPRLDGFVHRHPDLRIRVETATERRQLGDADAGIFYGPPTEKGLTVRPLIHERMTVLCSPALLADGPPLRAPADLAGHVLIHARNRVPWRDWLTSQGLADLAVRRELSVERSTMAIDAALRGTGVILESDFLCADEMRDGRLVEPFAADCRTPAEPAYYLATRGAPGTDPRLALFIGWIEDVVGGAP